MKTTTSSMDTVYCLIISEFLGVLFLFGVFSAPSALLSLGGNETIKNLGLRSLPGCFLRLRLCLGRCCLWAVGVEKLSRPPWFSPSFSFEERRNRAGIHVLGFSCRDRGIRWGSGAVGRSHFGSPSGCRKGPPSFVFCVVLVVRLGRERERERERETMEQRRFDRAVSFGISDAALERVMAYVDDPRDREAISLVCKKWYRIDALSRKHVTVAICYSTTPDRLLRRFLNLESLKLKGKPRAAMFNLIPEDWGGYAGPWIRGLVHALDCLKALHFRRMIVSDEDIDALVRARGNVLKSLKLDKCSGFSTDGLLLIARSCKNITALFLEESLIVENDDRWVHELAVNNSVLEALNFYMTELRVTPQDLELLARNCKSLVSLKISECDISDLVGFFRAATSLEEFGGGSFNDQVGEVNKYDVIRFPPRLCCVGLIFMGTNEMNLLFPFAAALKKLDLQYTFLSTEDHCQLIERCPNLEVLEVRDVIGDRGLEVVAQTCKRLRRLRIERGDDEHGLEDEQGRVTQLGLSALARGCPELEYLAVYASDITNAALESLGTYSKNLCDFRLVLLDREERITDLPLDNGVRALLIGCTKIRRFAFYLRPGGLSDVGLGYIGENSSNIRWMLLGNVGDSDAGLLMFSRGCPLLQKLELRSCCFSERALALAATQLPSLRYLWVQGYRASPGGGDLLAMARPFWNIEFIPPIQVTCDTRGVEAQAQILAYYSLVGRRTDCPESVIPLYPASSVHM